MVTLRTMFYKRQLQFHNINKRANPILLRSFLLMKNETRSVHKQVTPTETTIGTAKPAPPVSASTAARFWNGLLSDEQKPKPQKTSARQSNATFFGIQNAFFGIQKAFLGIHSFVLTKFQKHHQNLQKDKKNFLKKA